ncbi:peptidoglycan-binding protein, partial [Streptomyces sp. NPDC001231]|uniref:peptidoglycan-binding domain-containing protein n=1 Tax=Streptomyces sp. NPDC001231 TaxID=3364549 RepID=UPI0036C4F09A
MKRSPRALWTTVTTTLAIAALTALGAAQAPDTANASSSDPAAAAARPAGTSQQSWPTVRTGSHGHAVVALQHLLAARGHAVTPDGAFGPRTAAAVKTFQQSRSLEADGVVGPKTWNALITTLSTGSHGHAVVALQHLLAARGHAVTPDGAFGPRT